jgi:hypothetical protein
MMRAEQRQCVLYTLADGTIPVYSIHLTCQGRSFSLYWAVTLTTSSVIDSLQYQLPPQLQGSSWEANLLWWDSGCPASWRAPVR